mmetsp:Transcript_98/g.246  ORF Transcript_98/g.246 Transcript_98/m.246 type:complete len:220 (+) Transcript_98:608-1267(+)
MARRSADNPTCRNTQRLAAEHHVGGQKRHLTEDWLGANEHCQHVFLDADCLFRRQHRLDALRRRQVTHPASVQPDAVCRHDRLRTQIDRGGGVLCPMGWLHSGIREARALLDHLPHPPREVHCYVHWRDGVSTLAATCLPSALSPHPSVHVLGPSRRDLGDISVIFLLTLLSVMYSNKRLLLCAPTHSSTANNILSPARRNTCQTILGRGMDFLSMCAL